MAPARRTVLRLLAASAGLGACALGGVAWHYTRPEVQRGLALEALGKAGLTGDVAGVSVGLGGGFAISGVDLTDAKGRRYRVEAASGKIAVWDALFGEVHVVRLDASGVDANLVKVRRPGDKDDEDDEPSKPIAKLPVVRVDAADLAGTATTVAGRPVKFALRVREADTRSGATAVLTLSGETGGPVITGDASVKFAGAAPESAENGFALWKALAPTLSLRAEARPRGDGPVAANLLLDADAAGAKLALKSGAGVANLRATIEGDRVKLAGDWKLDRDALAAWTKATIPEFTASGSADIAYDFKTGSVDAKLAGSGRTAKPQLAETGPDAFAFDASFAGSDKTSWRIRNAHIEAGTARSPRALAFDAGELTLHTKGGPRVETAGRDGAALKLAGCPAVWLNPFLGDSGAEFVSGDFTGVMKLSGDPAGALTADTGADFSGTGLTLRLPGRPSVKDLRVVLPASVSRSAAGEIVATGRGLLATVAGKPTLGADVVWRGKVTGEGDLEAKLSFAPGALPGDFLPGGACKFCADTGLTLSAEARATRDAAGGFSVAEARVEAVTREGVRALSAKLLKPLGAGENPRVGEPVVALTFKGAPLALANPLLAGPVLGGVAEAGDLTVTRTEEGWRVARPAGGAPAFVRGLSWRGADGVELLAPTDARGTVAWERTKAGWRLALRDAAFSNTRGPALRGTLSAEYADGIRSADANLDFDLASLPTSLPSAAKIAVDAGTGSLKLKYDPAGESSADLRVSGVRRPGVEGEYGVSLAGLVTPGKSGFGFRAPATLTGPSGTTHFTVDGEFSGAEGARSVRLAARGDRLFADDWKAFAAGSPSEEAKAPPSREAGGLPAKPVPDKVSFWDGYTGEAELSFGSVEYAGERVGSPVVSLVVKRGRLETKKLYAEWRGLPVNAAATLDFRTGAAKPYALKADGALDAVPLGKVIAGISAKAAGWIDGDFSGKFSVSGEAETPGALAGALTCDADVKSRDGTIRFFNADNETVRMSGDLAGIAGDIAGGLGQILSRKTPAVSKALEGASVLQKALRKVDYKTLSLAVRRLPDGSIDINAASVENEILKISGTGKLGPASGEGFLDRNASITANVAGRNVIADALLGIAGKATTHDDAGWVSFPPLRYDGPLNNVKNNLLNNLLRSVSSPFLPQRGGDGDKAPVRGDPPGALDRILDRIPL